MELSKCSCTKHTCIYSLQLFSMQSSEMLGISHLYSGSASACLACFTLSHPLNILGTVCSLLKLQATGEIPWQVHQQGTPAGLGMGGVCWEHRRHTWDPMSSGLAEQATIVVPPFLCLPWGVCTLAQGTVMSCGVNILPVH